MSQSRNDDAGSRTVHHVKHALVSLVLLSISLVGMLTLEILKHNYNIKEDIFLAIAEHICTATFIAGVWHGIHEFFVKRNFIRIMDENTESILKEISTAKRDRKLGLIDTYHDVDAYHFTDLVAHPTELTIVLNDGYHWLSDHIQTFRKRFADPTKKTTFVFVHPDSELVSVISRKIGWQPEEYRKKIINTIKVLTRERKADTHLNILGHFSIGYHSAFLADSKLVVTPYFFSKKKQNPPVFIFNDTERDCFVSKVKDDLEQLIIEATDIQLLGY